MKAWRVHHPAGVLFLVFLLCATGQAGTRELPDRVDFGTIPHDRTAVRTVEVRNDGERPLYLDFVSTCPCLEVVPDSLALEPGSEGSVDLALDPAQYDGTIDKMVLVRSNAETFDLTTLVVRARVERPASEPAPGCVGCELLAEKLRETDYRDWLKGNWLVVDVYYTAGCRRCERLITETLPELENELRVRVSVRRHDIMQPEQYELFVSEVERRGAEVTEFPVVTVGDSVLQGSELWTARLRDVMSGAVGQETPTGRPPDVSTAQTATSSTGSRIAVLPVLIAGMADGVNPCAFATLLFLLSSLSVVGRNRREVLVVGATFAATVFATYYALGLGLLHALRAASYFPVAAEAIRWLMVTALAVFAALSVYDYILVRRGQASRMVLQLPDRFKRRIHASVRHGVRTSSLVAGAVAMGFGVSVFELGCTGQVYLPTISYMVQSGSDAAGYGLLTVYNVGFIAPLVALFAAVCQGPPYSPGRGHEDSPLIGGSPERNCRTFLRRCPSTTVAEKAP